MTEKQEKSAKVKITPSRLQMSKLPNKWGQSPTCSYTPCCQNGTRKSSPKSDDHRNKKYNPGILPNLLSYLSPQYEYEQHAEGQQAEDDPDV